MMAAPRVCLTSAAWQCRRANELRFVGASRGKAPLKVSTEESWMGVAVIALSPVTQRELSFDPMPTDRQIEVHTLRVLLVELLA